MTLYSFVVSVIIRFCVKVTKKIVISMHSNSNFAESLIGFHSYLQKNRSFDVGVVYRAGVEKSGVVIMVVCKILYIFVS